MIDTVGFDSKSLESYIGPITNIVKALSAKIRENKDIIQGPIVYNKELSYKCLSGHPDMMCDNVILDIKTTSSFKSMAESSILQVLAYYALAKQTDNYNNINYIGFILSNQRELLLLNLNNWDSSGYLSLLVKNAKNKLRKTSPSKNLNYQEPLNADETNHSNSGGCCCSQSKKLTSTKNRKKKHPTEVCAVISIGERVKTTVCIKNETDLDEEGIKLINNICMSPDLLIGHHIGKGTNITKSLEEYMVAYPGCPAQTRLRPKISCKMNNNTYKQIESTASLIQKTGFKGYIHTPYTINLAKDAIDKNGKHWAQEVLNEELSIASKMGFKGVVVHLGNKKDISEEDALNTMEDMVRKSLEYATVDCPLLLETGCGEKGELCCTLEELGLFFYRFTEEERTKLGLCADTCHLWASGIDPLQFLETWVKCFDIPVNLIHFNDSCTDFNSRVDLHASIGSGYIGYKKMLQIAVWATQRDIPMVIE
jgi:endonuclease IV